MKLLECYSANKKMERHHRCQLQDTKLSSNIIKLHAGKLKMAWCLLHVCVKMYLHLKSVQERSACILHTIVFWLEYMVNLPKLTLPIEMWSTDGILIYYYVTVNKLKIVTRKIGQLREVVTLHMCQLKRLQWSYAVFFLYWFKTTLFFLQITDL